jgi:hypothetical protein
MKFGYFLFVLLLFSCSPTEVEFEYPDRINQPSEVTHSDGCGNVLLYQYFDGNKALVVRIDGTNSNLTKERQSIDLEYGNSDVTVTLEIAGTSPDSIYFNYCNDVAYLNQGNVDIYIGGKGKLKYSVSEDNPIKDPLWESNYRITVEIDDLHLYDRAGNLKLVFDKIVYWDVGVGWMPG